MMVTSKPNKIAAILVGGKGTRLQSVISTVPKPLAPIAGEPFLFLLLRDLKAAGISKVILLTGYMHEKIVEACGDGHSFGLEIIYSKETQALGTGGALWHAQSHFTLADEFILLNGDTYIECSLTDFVDYSLEGALGAIGISSPDEVKRFGSVQINAATQVIEAFHEKSEQSTGLVNAGIYKLSTRLFSLFSPKQFCSLESEIFPQIIGLGEKLKAFFLKGAFYDIGVPESYADFNLSRTRS